ncbi:MAG: GvpL/GvpF family gas vesicle protein [Solirubrobacterales bacterium]|nr:GvpL/GvpF family gas vesicle protein [Solirubrobacterales bacterium]
MPHYIYGIVEANRKPPAVRGIADARLKLVGGDVAAALVSDLPAGEVRLGREEMLTHARVLEKALARGTVLPMRFGVVMSDADEIRERLLDEHAADLRVQLDEFDGKIEVRIRAVYEEESLLRDVVRADPEIAAVRRSLSGQSEDATYYARIQLGERVAAGVERQRERDADEIIGSLAAVALAVDEGKTGHERVAVNASFLVERARLKEFNDILDAIAEAYAGRVRFKYTGPLPPHSFVQLAGSA